MASATRLLLELSILALITAAATTTTTADEAYKQCYTGNGGDLAVRIMKSLVQDLTAKLPDRRETYYCNELTLEGMKMYGFAECRGRDSDGAASMKACTDCLDLAGKLLIDDCKDTATGYAWDLDSACYFKVGYSIDVCPKGTY
ncbi:unnamed protein product [Linum tenue]|uniref:Gnk2-homologous domain-containing protein n=1 Tax=Linum tenue TaxID=586396 RepID=A0AAV0N181_9ROSI|nr:unnamed protein product [Linum tenue]